MRLVFGKIPETDAIQPDSGWNKLKEPNIWLIQLIALPIGLIAAGLITLLWWLVNPESISIDSLSIWNLIVGFLIIIVPHELLHAVVHPGGGLSKRTILGFWPAALVFYAHYEGILTKNRFIAVFLTPLLVLSLLPPLTLGFLMDPPELIVAISVLNALLACVDIVGAFLIATQIPRGMLVRNKGWQTFWCEPGSTV